MEIQLRNILNEVLQSTVNLRPQLLLKSAANLSEKPHELRVEMKLVWKILGSQLMQSLRQSYLKVPGELRSACKIAILTMKSHESQCKLGQNDKSCFEIVDAVLNIAIQCVQSQDVNTMKILLPELYNCYFKFILSPGHQTILAKSIKSLKSRSLLKYNFDSSMEIYGLYLESFRCMLQSVDETFVTCEFGRWWYLHDQMVHVISSSFHNYTASAAVSIILKSLGRDPLLWHEFKKRYRHLERVAVRWKEPGVEYLNDLLGMYSLESHEIKLLVNLNENAAKIQAQWRGYVAKKNWNKMRAGFMLLQSRFRSRHRKVVNPERAIYVKELQRLENSRRVSVLSRKYLQSKYEIIKNMHPSLVDKFLESECDAMATRIQSWYRSCIDRRHTRFRAQSNKLNNAANVIQRVLKRRVLKRKLSRLKYEKWAEPTNEQIQKLQAIIDENILKDKTEPSVTIEKLEKLVNESQKKVAEQLRFRGNDLKAFHKRQLMVTQMKLDAQSIQDFGPLGSPVSEINTGSLSVRNAGRKLHETFVTQQNQPWWKKLDPPPILSVLEQSHPTNLIQFHA